MNILILGGGAEERAWARAIAVDSRARLLAAFPGFDEFPDVPRPRDLDDALARAGVEAVVVGGPPSERGEWLRRVAAIGLPTICLHPPGEDSEAYYQVALSREETGAIVIPDLPGRLHPGVKALRDAIEGAAAEVGPFRGLRIEWPVEPGGDEVDLARHIFPRVVDLVRALVGEVEAVTATGDPPGLRPHESLVVQLRAAESRRAEVRIEGGTANETQAPVRITLTGTTGAWTLECDPRFAGPARLVRHGGGAAENTREIDPWDPHAAILDVLDEAAGRSGRDGHPDLLDGTRAMELSEAVVRSLRRGRTVDLHYEEISEAGTFKGVMTSFGCVLLLIVLVMLPLALIGPPLGLPGTIYIAYLIPPVLILFILLQLLGITARRRTPGPAGAPARKNPADDVSG
jgi:predicted dehydrogenase